MHLVHLSMLPERSPSIPSEYPCYLYLCYLDVLGYDPDDVVEEEDAFATSWNWVDAFLQSVHGADSEHLRGSSSTESRELQCARQRTAWRTRGQSVCRSLPVQSQADISTGVSSRLTALALALLLVLPQL